MFIICFIIISPITKLTQSTLLNNNTWSIIRHTSTYSMNTFSTTSIILTVLPPLTSDEPYLPLLASPYPYQLPYLHSPELNLSLLFALGILRNYSLYFFHELFLTAIFGLGFVIISPCFIKLICSPSTIQYMHIKCFSLPFKNSRRQNQSTN